MVLSSQVEALAGIAPASDMTIWGEDHVAQSLARLRSYGRLTGQEARAADLEAALSTVPQRLARAIRQPRSPWTMRWLRAPQPGAGCRWSI